LGPRHAPTSGDEGLPAGAAAEILDGVAPPQGQDLAHAGARAHAGDSRRRRGLSGLDEIPLPIRAQVVVVAKQRALDRDALLDPAGSGTRSATPSRFALSASGWPIAGR
jgi:hypothetical protein